MNNNYNYMFKFIVVGDAFVGKTSLLLQFQQKEFCEDTQSTVSIEFRQKTITLNDQSIKLQAWDPAGFTQFLSMEKFYYKGAIGALLVFDFSRRSTFEDIKFWLNQIKTFACDKIELQLLHKIMLSFEMYDKGWYIYQVDKSQVNDYEFEYRQIQLLYYLYSIFLMWNSCMQDLQYLLAINLIYQRNMQPFKKLKSLRNKKNQIFMKLQLKQVRTQILSLKAQLVKFQEKLKQNKLMLMIKQIIELTQMLGIKVNNNYGKMKKNNKSPQQNITLNGKQNDEERNEKQRCC